jgi:hypothetical protein
LDLVATSPKGDPVEIEERHRAYDQYSAERDPAHALFKVEVYCSLLFVTNNMINVVCQGYFGETFAESMMHDFLFDSGSKAKLGIQ